MRNKVLEDHKMKRKLFLSILLCAYIFIHIKTLLTFPLMHSDEAWLGGLSLEYLIQKSPFVTEPFFDLFPRSPHLLKLFFHGIQAIFIALFGYGLFPLRLISLIFGLIGLYIFYRILIQVKLRPDFALLGVLLLATNIQFIYATHFARQEIILFTLLVFSYYLVVENSKTTILASGLIIGLGVGFHPNAFILSLMIGTCILLNVIHGKLSFKLLLFWGSIVGVVALIFPLTTLAINPSFVQDYYAYGKTLSVDAPFLQRFANMVAFYQKIFWQISGTYYLPNVRPVFYSLFFLFISSFFTKSYQKLYWRHAFGMLIAFNAGVFIIGRYNTTSIVFIIFPWCLMVALEVTTLVKKIPLLKRYRFWSAFVCVCVLSISSLLPLYKDINAMSYANYAVYEQQIKEHLATEGAILGNLSSGFIFAGRDFYDIRNLAYLDKNMLGKYIAKHNIQTIIYYEEYDYIHRNAMWEILYGSDDHYYDQMQEFLSQYGTNVYAFEAPYYGTRIIRYMGDYPWKIYIYHIQDMPTY